MVPILRLVRVIPREANADTVAGPHFFNTPSFIQSIMRRARTKTNGAPFYEEDCTYYLNDFSKKENPLDLRVKAAYQISRTLPKISDEGMISNSIKALCKTIADENEPRSLRLSCVFALAQCGQPEAVIEINSALSSDLPLDSKLLALKVLSLVRSKESISLLSKFARKDKDDDVCMAAAKELASIFLYEARKEAFALLDSPPLWFARQPGFASQLCGLLEICPQN
jgi:hypothetical protein